MAEELSSIEVRLAEQYVWVLDFVSRCALAVDEGNWHYLWDKAGQLAHAAERLATVAAEAAQASGNARPRKHAVAAAVAHYGRHYRAGRLLHPEAGP
jgi:hypothetical protein